MSAREHKPIGVFDSGIGGLTVLKEIMRLLPREDTVYLGDTARLPYGNKSSETVIRYALEATGFLLDKHIKLLVVACNTASAVGLPTLRARYRLPVLGVIEPGARRAVQVTRNGRIGVIGTERTIKSQAYEQAIHQIDPQMRVFNQACPLFVPIVEEGLSASKIADLTAQLYLKEMRKKKIDVLVLGCTHYPLLKKMIRKAIGSEITLIDSATEVSREVLKTLKKAGLLRGEPAVGDHCFYVTDYPERFQTVGHRFLSKKLEKVSKVKI